MSALKNDNSLRALAGAGPAVRVLDPDAVPVVHIPQGASVTALAAVHASPTQKSKTGSSKVLTPVRRSVRNQRDDGPSTAQLLAETNHTFVPNMLVKAEEAPVTNGALSPLAEEEAQGAADRVPDTEEKAASLLQNDRFKGLSPLGLGNTFDFGFMSFDAPGAAKVEDTQSAPEEPSSSIQGATAVVEKQEEQDEKHEEKQEVAAAVQVVDEFDFNKYLLGTGADSEAESDLSEVDEEVTVQPRGKTPVETRRARRRSTRISRQNPEDVIEEITQQFASNEHNETVVEPKQEENIVQKVPSSRGRRRSMRVQEVEDLKVAQEASMEKPARRSSRRKAEGMSPIKANNLSGSFATVLGSFGAAKGTPRK